MNLLDRAKATAGLGKGSLPYDMFNLPLEAEAARRAGKLKNIYHRGQDLAWDGREVLAMLKQKHGPIQISARERQALQNIFAMILWGELAAWKISAQLADRLVPLEAKMAATSQAHDEARHFYVMYDYLSELGEVPTTVGRPTRIILDMVLQTDSMLRKLTGMQLLVENLALTIFQLVRQANPEPILTDLLRYIEKDEARHVGLGVQYLPDLMRSASRVENALTIAFQLQIVAWTIRGLKLLEPDLAVLGVSPRDVIRNGRDKMFTTTEQLWEGMGMRKPLGRQKLETAIDSLCEGLFPPEGKESSLRQRVSAARAMWRQGGLDTKIVELA